MQSFPGQYKNEELLMVFRKHPITMRKGFYALLIPFVLASLPTLIWPGNLTLLWVALGGLALGFVGFSYFLIGWYFTVFIVTNQRLRQMTQKGLFRRSVVDLGLDRIQNLKVEVPGFSAAVFKFGTITVQTYVGDIVLDRLRDPETTYNQLLEIVNQYGNKTEPIGENETITG